MTNTKSQKNWLLSSFVFTLLSIATHVYLAVQHYQLKLGLAAEKSFCNLNSTFNCDAVAASPYSAVWGAPIAVFGILIHIVLFILLATVYMNLSSDSARLKRYSFFIAALIAFTSVGMGIISVTLVGSYCLFCIAAYLFSFLNFIAVYKIQDSVQNSQTAKVSQDFTALFTHTKWVGILLVLVPALGFLFNSVILDSYGHKQLDLVINDSIGNWKLNPKQNFSSEGLTYQKTAGEPKMTIVEFADFRCIHCKMAYPVLHAFAESRSDVKLVFKYFPLDGKCNKSIEREGDGLTCKLAATSYCAEKISNKGWEAHNWIFDRQQTFATATEFPEYLKQLSSDLQLDAVALQTCVDSDEAQAALLLTSKEGQDAKIQGTPSVFVNGQQLSRGQSLPVLEAVYDTL